MKRSLNKRVQGHGAEDGIVTEMRVFKDMVLKMAL